MIVLTADIHHMSLQTRDQQCLSRSEAEITKEYVDIVCSHGLSVTLFVTGKAVKEEPKVFRSIAKYDSVEFGGHTFFGSSPRWLYNGIFKRVLGKANGPSFYQDWEVRKTIRTFQEVLDLQIETWRDHAYRRDSSTYKILSKNGIEVVSDEVRPNLRKPYLHKDGIISLPINIMPDSDHMYHGWCKPENVDEWSLSRSKFPPELYHPSEWFGKVRDQVQTVVSRGGIATMLVHPAPMKIVDNFDLFDDLCSFLSTFESSNVSRLSEYC
jgi:hypothetical protein